MVLSPRLTFPVSLLNHGSPLSTSEQCLEDTIIVFTLWDPDYYGMVQNYLGECSVTLKQLKEADKQLMQTLWKPHQKSEFKL